MNEELRKLIQEEIRRALSESLTMPRDMRFLDGRAIIVGRSNGLKIATETDQKLGFFNTTPVVQQAKINDPSGGATSDTQARTAINEIINVLEALGFTASS